MKKRSLLKISALIVAFTLAVGAFGAPAMTTKADETIAGDSNTVGDINTGTYDLVGHRGYAGYAPMNSMSSIKLAVARNFKNIEFDIRYTYDYEWVVSHDDSLLKTCGVDLNISDLKLSQVMKYKYTKGNNISQYPNEKIPQLVEVLDYIQQVKASGKKTNFVIEIKDIDDDDAEMKPILFDAIADGITDRDITDMVTITSFHYSYLNEMRSRLGSAVHYWYLAKALDAEHLGYAKKCKPEVITFKGTPESDEKFNTTEMINDALSQGYKLSAYTIDSIPIMGAYYQQGVEMFVTNKIAPHMLTLDMLKEKYKASKLTVKLSKTSYTFDKTRKKPTATVTFNGQQLLEGLNYEISYTNNRDPEKGIVNVNGLNNFVGEKDVTFKINMPKVKSFKYKKSYATKLKMTWKKRAGVTGYIVEKYNYKLKKYEQFKKIKGNTKTTFTATKLESGIKHRFRVKTYYKVNNKTYNSKACAAKNEYTNPAKPFRMTAMRLGKGKTARLAWSRVKSRTGYNVVVATDKGFKKIVRNKNKKSNVYRVRKLNKKKKYYAKVRAYLKVGKKYYYGAFCKTVKIKKK